MIRKMRRARAAAAVLLTLLLTPSWGHTAANATRPAPAAGTARQAPVYIEDLKEHISGLFRKQLSDGSYRLESADSLLLDYPIVATLSLAIHRSEGDLAFSSRARTSIARYFKYLLTERDADGDFLVERAAPPGDRINQGRIEDAGYNALLALDLISLSRLCVDLKLPVDALFWREEGYLIAKRMIETSYDADARFFFPFDNRKQTRMRYFHSASFAPTLLNQLTGENIAHATIRHYLLRPDYLHPEVPFTILSCNDIPALGAGAIDGERLFKSLLLQLSLCRNGFTGLEQRFQGRTAAIIDSLQMAGSIVAGDPYAAAFAAMLRTGSYRTLYPRYSSFDILRELVNATRTIDDPDILKLRASIEAIQRNLLAPPSAVVAAQAPDSIDTDGLQSDIRTIYRVVSQLREQLHHIPIDPPWQEAEYFGADFPRAVDRFLDDVVIDARAAENALFETVHVRSGLRATCTLPREWVVSGQNLSFNIAVTTANLPVRIASIHADIDGYREQLFQADTPVRLVPGDSMFVFTCTSPMQPEMPTGIIPVQVTLEIETAYQHRWHYTTRLGAVLKKPVDFAVDFPHGRIIKDREIPITISLHKNATARTPVEAAFFSPAGLRVKEGDRITILMEQSQDSATVSAHLIPPRPCRPGSFPMVMKVFANSEDLGMMRMSFFKHYQWIFAGPFSYSADAIDKRFTPEERINLRDRFSSDGTAFGWRDLPEHAYAPNGEILLQQLMPAGGVGYLHTVIESAVDQKCAVYLSSNTDAALLVNGKTVLRIQDAEILSLQRAVVALREGSNEILVKTAGQTSPKLYFKLGDDEAIASDEFNNNLMELVEGYREFHEHAGGAVTDAGAFRKLVTFSYVDPDARSVAVIGSFNGWSPEHAGMKKMAGNRWEITLTLAPGKYIYRFLVNNRRHILDPMCAYQESDGYGGKNSVLFVE